MDERQYQFFESKLGHIRSMMRQNGYSDAEARAAAPTMLQLGEINELRRQLALVAKRLQVLEKKLINTSLPQPERAHTNTSELLVKPATHADVGNMLGASPAETPEWFEAGAHGNAGTVPGASEHL
ncbi:MAG: hypothetical protein AAFW84_34165 [Cyanobacteria bacterium J06635_15]